MVELERVGRGVVGLSGGEQCARAGTQRLGQIPEPVRRDGRLTGFEPGDGRPRQPGSRSEFDLGQSGVPPGLDERSCQRVSTHVALPQLLRIEAMVGDGHRTIVP